LVGRTLRPPVWRRQLKNVYKFHFVQPKFETTVPWAFSPRRGGVARTGMQGAATRIVAMVRQRIALAPND